MIEMRILKSAIAGEDHERVSALRLAQMHYGWALEKALKPKASKSTAAAHFRRVEELRHNLALLGDVRAPSIGRA